jgi:hypothetical protein
MADADDRRKIEIPKLEAAHRQLQCAIELWFLDKDEVSVHTLLAAAYQIIDDVNEKRGNLRDNLFRPDKIKPEYHRQWADMIRAPSNFFKHADRDPEGKIEFFPFSNMMFILYATTGLAALGVQSSVLERAFMVWLFLHERRFLSAQGIAYLANSIPIDQVNNLRPLSKQQFFEGFVKAAANHVAARD